MKRFTVFLLAVAAALLLASCGGQAAPPLPSPPADQPSAPAEESPAPPEELTLDVLLCGVGPETEEWFLAPGTGFVDRFEAENPGVRLKLELAAPDEIEQIVRDRLSAGDAPDIIHIAGSSEPFSDALFMSAEPCCPDALYGDFFPAFPLVSPDGTVRSLPDLASGYALYCNTALLDRAGVGIPGTWAELEEACLALLAYDGELRPLGLSMTDEESAACFACFAWSAGGGLVGADGVWALNSDQNVGAVDFVLSLVDRGFTNPNPAVDTAGELKTLFDEGALAMLLADSRLFSGLPGNEAGVTAAPVPAGPDGMGAALGSASYIAVLRDDAETDHAARTEAVKRFLGFYYDPENYVARAALEGRLPLTRSAAGLLAQAGPSAASWAGVLESCHTLPADSADWETVRFGLYSVEQLSLIGGDPRSALDELQASLAGGS